MSWFDKPWVGAAAALLTGILFAVSRDIGPIGPLALIAPVPVLVHALASSSFWRAALVAFVARAIGALGLVYAYADALGPPMLALWVAGQSFGFAANVLLTRWIALRGPAWAALLAYPLFTAATEFLFALVSPHGSFGALGYALVDVLPLLQVASLGGVAALSFVAALIPMFLAMLIQAPREWRTLSIVGGAPLALALVFGVARLSESEGDRIRIGLAAIDSLVSEAVESEAQALRVAESYADLTRVLARERLDFVVLPEKTFALGSGGAGAAPLARAAAQTNTVIVAGFDEARADGRRMNTARVFAPGGQTLVYAKRRLVPGLEAAFTPGDASLAIGDVGVAICKDFDFAPMIRGDSARGLRLMLAPAWDFRADGRLHARMALVRGVENGFALARAAADGRLTLSDANGRVIAERTTSATRPTTVVAEVGLGRGETIYRRFGDAFGWFVVVIAAGLLLASLAGALPAGLSRHAASAKLD